MKLKNKTLLYSRIHTFHLAELYLILNHKFDYISLIPPKIASFYATCFSILSSKAGRIKASKELGYLTALYFNTFETPLGGKLLTEKLCKQLGSECGKQMMNWNN